MPSSRSCPVASVAIVHCVARECRPRRRPGPGGLEGSEGEVEAPVCVQAPAVYTTERSCVVAGDARYQRVQ